MLKVEQLDKWFGRHQVLHKISFEIKPGHILGLIGANGAGKTTIMKAILGISSFAGHISLNDAPISMNEHRPLVNVGALIEYPGLYPYLTGREQLTLFANGTNRKAKVDAIVAALQLEQFVDVKAKKYSLGMLQKLGIALAFLNQPELVILDEPMNGLDPEATMTLRKLILQQKAQGVSFLISSHILSELQKIVDDVVIIKQGHIVANATTEAILAANQRFLLIQTDHNHVARRTLKQHGYEVQETASALKVKLDSATSINALLKILWDYQLKINRITETQGDLESSLLAVLEDQNIDSEVL